MTSFWSGWIIILTSITLILTLWILLANRKSDNAGGTTGHVHDGIEEYDNPLPLWWLVLFLGSMIFGVGYLIAFPGMGNFPGLLGWTQVNHYEAEVLKAEEQYAPLYAKYAATPIEQLHLIPEAMKMAQRIFGNNCAQCHGSDAGGAFGFPNLTDDDWLWGGEASNIRTTIVQGRTGLMPGWGGILQTDQVAAAVAFVQKVSGQGHDQVLAEEGQAVFSTYCVACHGAEGGGMTLLGAPNLTDNIWLYGSDETWIRQAIIVGRNNQMPAHNVLLSENKIHLLTAYVYGLSKD